MFSDLVGSTALSARMDPEDLSAPLPNQSRLLGDVGGDARVELGTWNFLHYDGCGVAPSCAILPMFTQPRHTSVRGFLLSASLGGLVIFPCIALADRAIRVPNNRL